MNLSVLCFIFLVIVFLDKHDEYRFHYSEKCILQVTHQIFYDKKDDGHLTPVEKFIPYRTIGRDQKIPKIIYQTHENDVIPWKVKYAVNSFIEKNPEYTYRYFNNTERRQFLEYFFGKTIVDCYDKLIPKAYKADVFRYAVVYTFGGCYFDIPYVNVDSINTAFTPDTQFFSSVDDEPSKFKINSAAFCATPQHQILKITLNKIIETVANQEYGNGSLHVTGPQKFMDALKAFFQTDELIRPGFYQDDIMILQRWHENNCYSSAILKPNQQFLAFTRYPDYQIDILNYLNNSHYGTLYGLKAIYNKQITVTSPLNYKLPLTEQIKHLSKKKDFIIPEQYTNLLKSKKLIQQNNSKL